MEGNKSMSDETQKKVQEKYAGLQQIDAYMKAFQQQLDSIQEQLSDLSNTKEWLEDVQAVDTETELLVPLTNGIFVKAKITDNSDVVVNVGTGTAVKKTISEARKMIDDQTSKLRDAESQIGAHIQQVAQKAIQLESEIQELIKNV